MFCHSKNDQELNRILIFFSIAKYYSVYIKSFYKMFDGDFKPQLEIRWTV